MERPYPLVREHAGTGTVYVSGAVGLDAPYDGGLTDREALDGALDEVAARLASVGLSLTDVAKVTYYLADMGLRPAVDAQFVERLAGPSAPARAVVGAAQLPLGAPVLIDAIAHRP